MRYLVHSDAACNVYMSCSAIVSEAKCLCYRIEDEHEQALGALQLFKNAGNYR